MPSILDLEIYNYKKFDNPETDVEILNNNGVDKCQNMDYEEAVADFNQALRLNPNNKIVYYNKGRAMIEWGYKQVLDAHRLIDIGFDSIAQSYEMRTDLLQEFIARDLQESFRRPQTLWLNLLHCYGLCKLH